MPLARAWVWVWVGVWVWVCVCVCVCGWGGGGWGLGGGTSGMSGILCQPQPFSRTSVPDIEQRINWHCSNSCRGAPNCPSTYVPQTEFSCIFCRMEPRVSKSSCTKTTRHRQASACCDWSSYSAGDVSTLRLERHINKCCTALADSAPAGRRRRSGSSPASRASLPGAWTAAATEHVSAYSCSVDYP